MQSKIRVSLVIPAYNEESHLRACLEAVAAQTVMPFEVLLVDNNSTDATAAIARSFPFVTIINESRQGVVYARDTGFTAARGDVIGRIDADTRLSPQWVEQTQRMFADTRIQAVSGSVHYYDVAWSALIDAIDLRLRGWMAHHMRSAFLWGANMAIRRSAWKTVAAGMCREGAFHEDLDLAAHLYGASLRVVYDAQLRANVSGRRIDTNPFHFLRYVLLNSRTYARHNIRERVYMYPTMSIILCVYVPARLLFRGYDPRAGQFSWRTAFGKRNAGRVDPASYKV
jgi:glycosyltransferase involved in cell wall biosynthesis